MSTKNIYIYILDKPVAKNTKFHKPKTKVHYLEKIITVTTLLIHMNQDNTDKKNSIKEKWTF